MGTARRCFEWVRDEIRHSWDYRLNPLPCAASEVLEADLPGVLPEPLPVGGEALRTHRSCEAFTRTCRMCR